MTEDPDHRYTELPVGVVLQRKPGVTRWQAWAWSPVALLPGAGAADWKLLREEGDVAEFHIGTLPLTLWRTDAEAYRVNLAEPVVCAYVVLAPQGGDRPYRLKLVTANPNEAMQYAEGGDDLVEKVPMPPALVAWVQDWTDRHFVEEPFKKRKRDRYREDKVQDGKGDPRIAQTSDVYRAPSRARKPRLS
ncbi:DUF3305 domain-containing protein [Marivita sp. GX14005]|uniref:DUF3305 domain-containing protein n=1 Tax=Marivita sp. GX14005 TaxID=2942276 RepID=UPI0020192CD1|nr:DUF3305 domain-containing protein [Marivita sp. GX14005]MCL3881061.1 DUF3305 domain-containing protein [Marivita sp. GX14005]